MADSQANSTGMGPGEGGESGGDQNPRSLNVPDHDRFLPLTNISRIMKSILPANGKIGKDAKETMQECASEFIGLITSEASHRCKNEKRKTINGDDLLSAMATCGFKDYLEPLRLYLRRYRQMEASAKDGGESSAKRDGQPSQFLQPGQPSQVDQFPQHGNQGFFSQFPQPGQPSQVDQFPQHGNQGFFSQFPQHGQPSQVDQFPQPGQPSQFPQHGNQGSFSQFPQPGQPSQLDQFPQHGQPSQFPQPGQPSQLDQFPQHGNQGSFSQFPPQHGNQGSFSQGPYGSS